MKKFWLTFIFGLILILAALALSVSFGVKKIPLSVIADVLFYKNTERIEYAIIMQRIPRSIFGILAGGALGLSGALMQSITRNPIADPSILGVNMGASLFVVIGLAFFNITSAREYIWLAILGAGTASVLVYAIATLGNQGLTPMKLALSGSAVSIICGSLVSTLMMPNTRIMEAFRFWQVGSIGGAKWENITLILPFLSAGFLITAFIFEPLNTLALGDEFALSLGVNVFLVRILGAFAAVLLCGATTALAGPIGFVGLMVPHLMRSFLGNDMKKILPLSFIGSAILLLFSDIIGRLVSYPGETEVGIVTAILGAPIFIYIIRSKKGGGL